MSKLKERTEKLSPEKRALLELLRQSKQAPLPVAPVIARRKQENHCPLSFAQERLWFLDQLEPGSPFYNVPSALRLKGDLDIDLLESCLSEIIRRHEILRTTFPVVNGEPVQAIAPATPFKLTRINLRAFDQDEKEITARRLTAEEERRPFDLANGPLLRARLLLLDENDYWLLFTLHHILTDGWSTGLFMKEVAALYKAGREGMASALPELPIQYADYAAWQREKAQVAALDSQAAYWKAQLGGKLPVLDLPFDRPRPPLQTYAGATHTFALSLGLRQAIKSLGQQESATPFMTLLAAFNVLLHRYTMLPEIVVGTPIAGRSRPQLENLIGFFANTLVLRTSLSGEPAFRDVLRRTRDVALSAFANADLPFEKVVEIVQPERDMSRPTLFQVWFGMQNLSVASLELPGLTLSAPDFEGSTAKFDLSLDMWEEADGLKGLFEYNTDLFNATTVAQMAIHFEALLESLVENPDRAISMTSLLTIEQKRAAQALEEEATFDFDFALQEGLRHEHS
jgi:Condensation domain